jgi:tRNA modification GTPase
VFDRPGTTRDVLTASAALDGWPVELADTAGLRGDAWLRAPHDAIESAGIARARASMAAADLVLLVCDASQWWTEADEELMSTIAEPLVVHNKCDLPGAAGVGRPPGLAVSALTGEGLLQLIAAISRRLVPAPPAPGSPLPFTLRQVRQLQAAQQAVERGDLAAARLHACLGNAGQ